MIRSRFLVALIGFGLLAPAALGFAQQADGPFEALRARNSVRWAEEDRDIDDRLAALEARFGKKPNIIYILTDDIGWGELGWQGGGKHRGTPTPSLDQMAFEGMRFWSAYAEPSCTPTRSWCWTKAGSWSGEPMPVSWPGAGPTQPSCVARC